MSNQRILEFTFFCFTWAPLNILQCRNSCSVNYKQWILIRFHQHMLSLQGYTSLPLTCFMRTVIDFSSICLCCRSSLLLKLTASIGSIQPPPHKLMAAVNNRGPMGVKLVIWMPRSHWFFRQGRCIEAHDGIFLSNSHWLLLSLENCMTLLLLSKKTDTYW